MASTGQNLLLLLRKSAGTALPAAPRPPNPAPQPPKTPSFTTRPPTVARAVADVRPGLPRSVTQQTQSLGTAQSPVARQVSVSKQIVAPKEFASVKAVPLAKTAQSIACGGGPCWGGNAGKLDTSKWTRADWRRYIGLIAAAPAAAAAAPAIGGAATVGGGLGALGHAILAVLGGYGAGTGAFDAASKARAGDYGEAARDAVGAVVSGAFPYAGKARAAMTALRGSTAVLGTTDLLRSYLYGRDGMPAASAAAATGAVADLSLLLPGARSLRSILPSIVASSVARPLEDRFAQKAFGDRVKAVYDRALGPTVAAAQSRLSDAGVRDAAGAAKDLGDMASTAAHAVDTARPSEPSFLSGLLATKDLQYVKALENEAASGGTAGSRTAANGVREAIDSILGRPGSARARLSSAAGWLSRNGKWVLPTAGALAAGAAGLKLYNAIKSRRKQKEHQ